MATQLSVRVMVLIERRLVGKPGTYTTSSRVRERVSLVNLNPLTEHERPSAMDTSGEAVVGVRGKRVEGVPIR